MPAQRARWGGGLGAAALAAWNPADAGVAETPSAPGSTDLPGFSLANSRIACTVHAKNGEGGSCSVRATLSRPAASTGKFAWGFTYEAQAPDDGSISAPYHGVIRMGFANSQVPLNFYTAGTTQNGVVYELDTNRTRYANVPNVVAALAVGDSITAGIDFDARTASFWKNGVLLGGAINVGATGADLLRLAYPIFPWLNVQAGSSDPFGIPGLPLLDHTMSITGKFSRAAMPFVPAGYLSWNGD